MAERKPSDDLDDPSLLLDGDDDPKDDDGGGDDLGLDGDDKNKDVKKADDHTDRGFEIEYEADALDERAGALDDDDDDDGGGDKDKGGDKDYGRKVRERIERERRLSREARASAANERAARLQAEARAFAREKSALETTEAALDALISSKTTQLKQAKEDGKTDDEIKLSGEIARHQADKVNVEHAKRQAVADEEKAKVAHAAPGPNPLAHQWMRNNPWFNNERYREQTEITRSLDRTLSAEGYDKDDPEYYRELTRRAVRRMPELRRFYERKGGEQRPQRRDPTGGVIRRQHNDNGGERKGVIRLSRSDVENMRAFGLDPNDKATVIEYAKNKQGGDNAR